MAPGIVIIVDGYAFYTSQGLPALHHAFSNDLRFAFRCRRCDTKLNVSIDSNPNHVHQPLVVSNATFRGHLHRPQAVVHAPHRPCLPAAQLNLRAAAWSIQFNGYRPDTEHHADQFRDDPAALPAAPPAAAPPPADLFAAAPPPADREQLPIAPLAEHHLPSPPALPNVAQLFEQLRGQINSSFGDHFNRFTAQLQTMHEQVEEQRQSVEHLATGAFQQFDQRLQRIEARLEEARDLSPTVGAHQSNSDALQRIEAESTRYCKEGTADQSPPPPNIRFIRTDSIDSPQSYSSITSLPFFRRGPLRH